MAMQVTGVYRGAQVNGGWWPHCHEGSSHHTIIAKQENRLNVARSLQEKPEDFPGGPVVKTLCLHCRGLSSILDGRTEIAHAVGMAKKKKTTTRNLNF